jgi:hypothetical protein
MSKTQMDPASAELEKARELATADGNTFHAKVATYFRKHVGMCLSARTT